MEQKDSLHLLADLGPSVLGDTSPRLVEAKAATKGDCPAREPGAMAASSIRLAAPLLSPEM